MRAVYSHIPDEWRKDLVSGLQWLLGGVAGVRFGHPAPDFRVAETVLAFLAEAAAVSRTPRT
jgi:hypothetical protein